MSHGRLGPSLQPRLFSPCGLTRTDRRAAAHQCHPWVTRQQQQSLGAVIWSVSCCVVKCQSGQFVSATLFRLSHARCEILLPALGLAAFAYCLLSGELTASCLGARVAGEWRRHTAQHSTAHRSHAAAVERCYYRSHVMPVVVALHTPCALVGGQAVLFENWCFSHA